MKWQEKMKLLVEDILNYGMEERPLFELVVEDETHFHLLFCGTQKIMQTETLESIAPHWKEQAKKIINMVIEYRIRKHIAEH